MSEPLAGHYITHRLQTLIVSDSSSRWSASEYPKR